MKIKEIEVSAGRTTSNPYEQYANIRCHVKLAATVEDGEDADAAVKTLQAQAERLVEEHKDTLLEALGARNDLREADRQIASLESGIEEAQARLQNARMRKESILSGRPALVADTQAQEEEREL